MLRGYLKSKLQLKQFIENVSSCKRPKSPEWGQFLPFGEAGGVSSLQTESKIFICITFGTASFYYELFR